MVTRLSRPSISPIDPFATAQSRILDLFSLAIADGFVSPDELALIHERGRELGLDEARVNDIIKNPHKVQFVQPESLQDAVIRLYDLAAVLVSDGTVDPREVEVMQSFARRFGIKSDLIAPVVEALVDEIRAGCNRDELISSLAKELGS